MLNKYIIIIGCLLLTGCNDPKLAEISLNQDIDDVLGSFPVVSKTQQHFGNTEVQKAVISVNNHPVVVEAIDGQVALVSYYMHDEREEEYDRLSDVYHRNMGVPEATEWVSQKSRPSKPFCSKFRLSFRYAGIHQEYYRSTDNNVVLSHTENLIRKHDGITFVSLYNDDYQKLHHSEPPLGN
ncbi:hypothetical protein TUM12370_23620 [Salmonella enterica subsp. enterica serovar Choleraesuis]|nr:hypothetical protein TUM12370_23620 [Salmonella enterica subsp. enterica serovar Choleraesuis]